MTSLRVNIVRSVLLIKQTDSYSHKFLKKLPNSRNNDKSSKIEDDFVPESLFYP